jgi:hypothetical protein
MNGYSVGMALSILILCHLFHAHILVEDSIVFFVVMVRILFKILE